MRRKSLLCILAAFTAIMLACTYATLVAHRRALPHVTLGKETMEELVLQLEATAIPTRESDGTYTIEFTVPLDRDDFYLGDEYTLYVPSARYREIPATVVLNNANEEDRTLRMCFEDADMLGGEEILLYHAIEISGLITVPTSAVHEDTMGEYVLLVVREDSVWGYVYRVEKQTVYTRYTVDNQKVLSTTVGFKLPLAIECDRYLSDGDEVRIYP